MSNCDLKTLNKRIRRHVERRNRHLKSLETRHLNGWERRNAIVGVEIQNKIIAKLKLLREELKQKVNMT